MPADLVRVVEASYDIVASEPDWIRAQLVAVRPMLDCGGGMFGWVLDKTTPRSIVTVDTHAQMEAAIRGIHEGATTDDYEAGYQPKPGTLSERFGPIFATLPITQQFLHPYGIRDSLGINALEPTVGLIVLGAPLPRESKAGRSFVRRSLRIARHVATAARLRRRLAAALAEESAILTPDGRVAHAIGEARDESARNALRRAILDRERARGVMRRKEPDRALELFRGLVAGRWSIADRFDSDGKRFLVAYENPPEVAASRMLTPSEARVVTLVSMGLSLKLVAYELGVSQSTVTTHIDRALAKTGLSSRTELVRWFRAGAGSP